VTTAAVDVSLTDVIGPPGIAGASGVAGGAHA
jgi:hypothetical protein